MTLLTSPTTPKIKLPWAASRPLALGAWLLALVLLLSSGLLAAHDAADHEADQHCGHCLLAADRDDVLPAPLLLAWVRPEGSGSVAVVLPRAPSPKARFGAAQPRAPPFAS